MLSILFNTYAQTTKKALFLGNSYTQFNNLPNLIESLATANGDVLIHDQNTPGGYKFEDHSTNATSLSKINSNDWDFVVLQAQSQEPSFHPSQVAADTKPYAVILNDSIKANNSCTKTMFYMTWGRENGDASNCANYPPICTYDSMQARLRESYLEMTVENNAECAPVGVAWKKVREDFPAINLYNADESHPSIYGSYLAACVFYSSMYHKTTVGNTYWSTLDSLTAYRLQDIASSTVLDSLPTWHIESTDTFISFCDSVEVLGNWFYADTNFVDTVSGNPCDLFVNYEIEINQGAVITNFEQLYPVKTDETGVIISLSGDNYDTLFLYHNNILVYTSTKDEPYKVFYCNNNSLETLEFIAVAKNECKVDSVTKSFRCGGLSSINDLNASNFQIVPNPANSYLEIKTETTEDFTVTLTDISGKTLIKSEKSNHQHLKLDVSTFDKGIYFLVIYDKTKKAIGQKKVIIN